jgi:hypothetical protein
MFRKKCVIILGINHKVYGGEISFVSILQLRFSKWEPCLFLQEPLNTGGFRMNF